MTQSHLKHLMLFSDATSPQDLREEEAVGIQSARFSGQWRFLLEDLESDWQLEVTDAEPGVIGERLELLAVVRGLESIEGPSRVTLVTPSRYVSQGLRFGLPQWRADGWQWELHGVMTDIRNADLWRRVDQALKYHQLQSRYWRIDQAAGEVSTPHFAQPQNNRSRSGADRRRAIAGRWMNWFLGTNRSRGEKKMRENTGFPVQHPNQMALA